PRSKRRGLDGIRLLFAVDHAVRSATCQAVARVRARRRMGYRLVAGAVARFFVEAARRDFDVRFFVCLDLVVVVVVVVAPDVTREECFVRCLTVFLAAASAEPPSAIAAISDATKS